MFPRFTHESGTIRDKQAIDVSKLKRLLCYESQHQSQSYEKSLEQFDYEKAVSNYVGTQSTFKGGRGDIRYCAILWAMRGSDVGAQTKGLIATIVLIRVQKLHKTIYLVKAFPWSVFLGYSVRILPVSRLYLTVSLVPRCIPVSIYIQSFCSRSTIFRCIPLYPAVSVRI